MFITDKDGRLIFFPWGRRRRGYVLNNKDERRRITIFFVGSILFFGLGICLTIGWLGYLWLIVGLILAGSWLMIWYFYLWNITKSVPAVKTSYVDIVLDKITADSESYSNNGQTEDQLSGNQLVQSSKGEDMATVKNSDEFLTKNHERLLRIADLANAFAWIVFIVNLLLVGGRFVEIQNSYLIQHGLAGDAGNSDLLAVFSGDPVYAASVAVDLLSIFLRGVVYGLVLKGISLGLNMIVETDLNASFMVQGENHE